MAERLAEFVAKNGRQFEQMTRERNPPDSASTQFQCVPAAGRRRAQLTARRFLHDTSSVAYAWYEHTLETALETAVAACAGAPRRGPSLPLERRSLLVAVR